MEPHLVRRRSGIRVAVAFLTLVLASLCFIQWFRFASAYSGMIGLKSEIAHIASAKNNAILYSAATIVFECAATALLTGFLHIQMFESRIMSLISRVLTALVAAILSTCILVTTITWVLGRFS
jgi:hypothetical protein